MAKIEINIDDAVLNEAEKILNSLGMNCEIAVNIFLRRVALEKGLPMTMAVPVTTKIQPDLSESDDFDSYQGTRTNIKITPEMVEGVWESFLTYLRGSGEISKLSTELSTKTGINRGSAFIYLNILSAFIKGEFNTRIMKMKDLDFFMGKIKSELGDESYQNALKSLELSIPYWQEKVVGNYADKVEAYCRKHS